MYFPKKRRWRNKMSTSFWTDLSLWLQSLQLSWWQGLIFFIFILFSLLLAFSKPIRNYVGALLNKLFKKKRSCNDCVSIVVSKSKQTDLKLKNILQKIESIERTTLKKQMNFVEVKLDDLENKYVDFYNDKLATSAMKSMNTKGETVQYRMFWGLMKEIIHIRIKDELRRCCKENGFSEISGVMFSGYVKDKTKQIVNMIRQHIINFYPAHDMIVGMQELLEHTERIDPKIEDLMFDVFNEAKSIHNHDIDEIEKLNKEYDTQMETFDKDVNRLIAEV